MKRLLLIFILAFILLTGCSNDNETSPSIDLLTPKPTATPMGELTVKPKEGGTVTLSVSGYSSLNPLNTDSEDIKYYMSLVYDSLFNLDYQLKQVNGLAVSASSEDKGLTWIIQVRDDVKWHNGNVFNAADCVYTINYIMRNNGLYAANVFNIESCSLKDEFTLSIKLKKPDLYLANKLTFPIVPSFQTDISKNPMGTSMYMYTSTEENKLLFKRNENYWGEKPYIDTIEITRYENERLKLESESDIFILSGEFVSRYLNKSGYVPYKYTGRGYSCLMPNLKSNSILKEKNLRKALLYCIDNTSVIKSAVSGYGASTTWPIVSGTQYYQDGSPTHVRDLLKAAEYLQNAGYVKNEDGRWYRREDKEKKYPLTIPCNIMNGNIQMRKCADAIKKQVEELGIIFNIVLNNNTDYRNALENGTYTLALVDMNVGTWPEFETLFSTRGRMNVNGYSNTTLDSLMVDIYETDDISVRMTEIKSILDEDLPLIGLYFSQEAIVISERVLGKTEDTFFWNPFNGFNKLHLFTEGVLTK